MEMNGDTFAFSLLLQINIFKKTMEFTYIKYWPLTHLVGSLAVVMQQLCNCGKQEGRRNHE
jgi:hypothetical protein